MPSSSPAKRSTPATPVRAPRRPARRVASGDIPPQLDAPSLERHRVARATTRHEVVQAETLAELLRRHADSTHGAAHLAQDLTALLDGSSPDERKALRRALRQHEDDLTPPEGPDPDTALSKDWRSGGYPYKNLLSRKSYEKQKYRLQVELLKLQAWVKETGARVVILFEGRDAAGKGGTIKRFMEHLNPRGARVVALEKPGIRI